MNRFPPAITCAILCVAALAGCQRAAPQDQAAKDARAVAMVEHAQRKLPPIEPLTPDPVSFADLKAPDVTIPLPSDAAMPAPGGGCHFRTAPDGPALFVATPAFGLAKFDGRLEMLAADSGSPALRNGLHRDYAGGGHAIRLIEAPSGRGVTLTISDRYDRVVYSAPGGWQCGGKAPLE